MVGERDGEEPGRPAVASARDAYVAGRDLNVYLPSAEPGPAVILPRMAVYYPYIHIRDERWLKIAALYWPRMVRIVSPDYPTRNSELVDVLAGELGFIIDHPPGDAARGVSRSFARFVEGLGPEDLLRMRVVREGELLSPEDLTLPRPPAVLGGAASESCVPEFEHYTPRWSSDGAGGWSSGGETAGVHQSEVSPALTRKLIDAGLAVPARQHWLAMNPGLAWLYKCRLTEELASRNNLIPATDQLPAHAVIGESVAAASLTGQAGTVPATEAQAGFGLLSVDAVIPRDLDQVSPATIVEIRRRFSAQFDRWREYADEIGAGLAAQLQGVESPDLLRAYLDDAVRKYSTGPVNDLRNGLAAAGVDTVTAAASTKFTVPTAAVAGLAAPRMAVAGGAALAVAPARRTPKARQAAPVAYLLDVRETLTPRTRLSRIITIMSRAAGLHGQNADA
jgi:Family of unknown function (DUF6236)